MLLNRTCNVFPFFTYEVKIITQYRSLIWSPKVLPIWLWALGVVNVTTPTPNARDLESSHLPIG